MLFLAQSGPYLLLASSAILMIVASHPSLGSVDPRSWPCFAVDLTLHRIANALDDVIGDVRGIRDLWQDRAYDNLCLDPPCSKDCHHSEVRGLRCPFAHAHFLGCPSSALSLLSCDRLGLGLVGGRPCSSARGRWCACTVGVSIALMDEPSQWPFISWLERRAALGSIGRGTCRADLFQVASLGIFKLIKRKMPDMGILTSHSKPTIKLFMQYFRSG